MLLLLVYGAQFENLPWRLFYKVQYASFQSNIN